MLNILIGAAIGALVNTGAYVAIQLWRGQPISGKAVAAAAVGGVVAGALAGTTFGASLLAGTTTDAVSFLAFDGGVSAASQQVAANALNKQPLGNNVANAAAWGAATAPVTGVVLRGVGSEISNFVTEGDAAAANAAGAGTAAAADGSAAAATGAASTAAAPAAAATDGATAAKTALLPLAHHLSANTATTLGYLVAHAAFGAPWVGEGVQEYQNESSNATPTSPSGMPLPATSGTASSSGSSTTTTSSSTTPASSASTTTPASPIKPLPIVPRRLPIVAGGPSLGAPSGTKGALGALGSVVDSGADQ